MPENYDYEDDDYTFERWLDYQSFLKIQDYEN